MNFMQQPRPFQLTNCRGRSAGWSEYLLAGISMSAKSTEGAARFERCAILCARLRPDAPPDQADAIRVILNSLDTDGWWFVNPGTFVIAFGAESAGGDRAKTCQAALHRLTKHDSTFRLGLGSSEGEVLCTFSSAGRLASLPMGAVVNEAMFEAVRNAS